LKAHRKGAAWVIHEEDFKLYSDSLKRKNVRKAS
jgi:hypothetical protein